MSTSIETIALPSPLPPRSSAARLGDVPMIPIIILGVIAFTAIFANFLAPHNPEVGSLTARFHPPFWQAGGTMEHLLGTDQLGRDVLSRLIFGARVSMVVGFTAVIFAGVVGTVLGILAGYLGGWVDQVDHAHHRRLARVAGTDLRHLPRRHRRPEHVEHRDHPRRWSTGHATRASCAARCCR